MPGRENGFIAETTTSPEVDTSAPTAPTNGPTPQTAIHAAASPPPVAVVEAGAFLQDISPEPGLSEIRMSEGPRFAGAALPTLDPATFARPDFARFVTGQVADMIRAGSDGALEVTLRPEELGRVSLTLNGDGSSMNVSLTAERAETLDLLKRNISLLERDLADLGYSELAFDFGDAPDSEGSQESHPDGTFGSDITDENAAEAALIAEPTPAPRPGQGGMDLRL